MAACFYAMGFDKQEKSGSKRFDDRGRDKKLASTLNVKSDGKGRPSWKERIHQFGDKQEVRGLQRSNSDVGVRSSLRSLPSLVDCIASQRYPGSPKFDDLSTRASSSELIGESNDGSGERANLNESWRKKLQFPGGSFRKLVSRGHSEEISSAEADALADSKQQQHRLVRCETSCARFSADEEKNLRLLLALFFPADRAPQISSLLKEQQNVPGPHDSSADIAESSKDPSDSMSLGPQHKFRDGLRLTKVPPFSQTDSVLQDGHRSSSGLIVIDRTHAPGTDSTDVDDRPDVAPLEPKPEWERVLETTLAEMRESSPPVLKREENPISEIEEVLENPGQEIVELGAADRQNSPNAVGSRSSIAEIEAEEKPQKWSLRRASISRVAWWLGRLRGSAQAEKVGTTKAISSAAADKREGSQALTAELETPPLAGLQTRQLPADDSMYSTPQMEVVYEENLDEEEEITLSSGTKSHQVVAIGQTKSAGVSSTDSGPKDGGINEGLQSVPASQPLPPRLSFVLDHDAMSGLRKQRDIVDSEEKAGDAAQKQAPDDDKTNLSRAAPAKKPKAAPAGTTGQLTRRVRFSAYGGGEDFSVVDISATLLGKLSATKHQQVRFLQGELEQSRAKVVQLEQDLETQRGLKSAFQVQAVRLGASLKKLRAFAHENGLDPRTALVVTPASQPEVSQASESVNTTRESDSSPELDALRTQAKQLGWLCDPNEVELREKVGSGSKADIFKGVWENVDVAVKCFRPDVFEGNMEGIGGFFREVEVLSRQRHPHILRMFTACLSPPDQAWIITEYLSSGTLTEWLHGTKTRERKRIVPLPSLSERLRIATEISMAMQHLHESSPKVLHRDLKPNNVLLDEDNHVRIVDFNCARFLTSADADLTGETGTHRYMAPEVMAHEFYDEKCDIYSFAVILCELVTGTPPYIDSNLLPAEIACKVSQGSLRPTLPEKQHPMLVKLIQDAWEQDPRKRPSFSGITATLKVIAGDLLDVVEPITDSHK